MNQEMHQLIIKWLEEAAENLRQSFKHSFKVKEKTSASDLVTEMDQATERFFVEKIKATYPDHRILGEEGIADEIKDDKGVLWVIDPIDGTLNFVKQHNNFGIMIGIYEDGEPKAGYIYDVMKHDLYHGINGEGAFLNAQPLQSIEIERLETSLIAANSGMLVGNLLNSLQLLDTVLATRNYGAAALGIISVIRGETALYLSSNLNPWDFGAGWAICESMGFVASQPNGKKLNILHKSPVVFAHSNVYNQVVELLATPREIGEINEHA